MKNKKQTILARLYERIGEEGFQKGAKWLILLLCISPLIAGVVNFIMLSDIPSYDPYVYNDRWIIISDTGFILMTLLFLLYITGKMLYNEWNLLFVIKKIKQKEPWLLFWLALLCWGIIPSLTSVSIRGALFGATELHSGYITHIFMLCVMGCAYLLNDDGRKKVLYTYIFVSDILAIIMLWFNYCLPYAWRFTGYAGDSVFTNSNHYGYYLAMAIPCFAGLFIVSYEEAEKNNKNIILCIISLISFTLHMQTMVINDCMGGFLGAFFSLMFLTIYWCIRRKKIRFAYLLPMFILVLMVYLSYIGVIYSILGATTGTSLIILLKDFFSVAQKSEGYEASGSNRIFLWKQAIAAISKRPLLGYGPDLMYNRDKQAVVSMTPHNEFLECALYMGIPGLLLYLGGLFSLFFDRVRRMNKLPDHVIIAAASVIAYQISAFFGVRKFHIVPYMFMFLGFIVSKENEENIDSDIA